MKILIAISFVGLILVTLGDASELKQEARAAKAAKLLQDNIYAEIKVLLEESIKENAQKEKLIIEVTQ